MNRTFARKVLAASVDSVVELYYPTEINARNARLALYKARSALRKLISAGTIPPSTKDIEAIQNGDVFCGDSSEIWVESAAEADSWPESQHGNPWRVCISGNRHIPNMVVHA